MNPFEKFPVTSIGGVNALKASLDFIAAMEKLEHMNIDTTYKRAVRIIGKPGAPYGKAVLVYDALTEEQIENVKSAVIYLGAADVSKVILTYYEKDEQGNIVTEDHHPVIGTTTIINKHEVDVTAFEVNE